MDLEFFWTILRVLRYLLILRNLYYLIFLIRWAINYVKKLIAFKNISHMPIIPIIGNAHQLKSRTEFLDQFVQLSKTYNDKPFFVFWLGWIPFIMFHKVDYIEFAFVGSENTQKNIVYDFLHPWLGEGLLTSHGKKWKTRRDLITPTFHFEILNNFLLVMNDKAEIMVEKLEEQSKTNSEVDIYRNIALCALDIICETAMGKNIDAQNNSDSEYVEAVSKIFQPYKWNERIFNWTQSGKEHKRCLKILHGLTKKVMMERNEELEENNFIRQNRVAFLDMLLMEKHTNSSLSFEDIQEEVDTFMFEGHDTTAVSSSWACQLIGSHPEVQKKLHEEIDNIFGLSYRHITTEDLKNLKYLDCVIKETLRLYPSVPFFGRVTSVDEVIAGQKIPKGTNTMIFSYMVHRDKKHFKNPDLFDPDRFLPQNCQDRHPFAYIPFSAGKRNCVGQRFAMMEEKIMLANILRKFEIKSLKPNSELYPVPDVILKPIANVPVKLILRHRE